MQTAKPHHLKETLDLITRTFDEWFGIVAGTDAGDLLWLFCIHAYDSRDMSSGYNNEEYVFTSALTDLIDFIDQMEEAMGSCHV